MLEQIWITNKKKVNFCCNAKLLDQISYSNCQRLSESTKYNESNENLTTEFLDKNLLINNKKNPNLPLFNSITYKNQNENGKMAKSSVILTFRKYCLKTHNETTV